MTPRSARAFTLMELLVVLALTSVVTTMLVVAMNTLMSSTDSTLERSRARNDMRDVMDAAAVSLRGAQPLQRCVDTANSNTPAANCVNIVRDGDAISDASTDSLEFYSTASVDTDCGPSGAPLSERAPQLVRIEVRSDGTEDDAVIVERFCANPGVDAVTVNAGDYGDEPVFATRLDGVDQSDVALFTYFDENGDRIDVDGNGSVDVVNRGRIALVRVTPQVEHRDPLRGRGAVARLSDEMFIALPGTRFERESSWTGG